MKRVLEIAVAIIFSPYLLFVCPMVEFMAWERERKTFRLFGLIYRFYFNCFVHRLTGNYNIYL